ncbi:alpha/beta fold hydrolase [Aquimarina sp. U1-2]|uniref:alpha/beta hydrolase family protein n=1 Tax=Aquimarina sp. U1-2 TaxID=2823141 RepID=UPI001AECA9CA|nr:alpha/beta hydrolase [Aquimarina sp. U1-2]MBP2831171.1 alpha/beta fold hydrolase [Aquimarina sp. U1-2]
MTTIKNIILQGRHRRPIITDVFFNRNAHKKPIVIFCHGYKGFKDWGAWDLVATAFAKANFFFVKFNFSHNGGTPKQPIDFPDLEAFGNNTYIKELDDLETIIDWVSTQDFDYSNEIDPTQITLIGHSRGGGIVTIKAAEDERITKIITWASVSDYKNRFPKKEAFHFWKKNGVYYVENGRTKQKMPHYFEFYTSFVQNEERLTISRATKRINIPHLIIHGTNDQTVPVTEGKNLHSWNPESELFLVENANHVFGAKHPWDISTLPEHLDVITSKSIRFAIF